MMKTSEIRMCDPFILESGPGLVVILWNVECHGDPEGRTLPAHLCTLC